MPQNTNPIGSGGGGTYGQDDPALNSSGDMTPRIESGAPDKEIDDKVKKFNKKTDDAIVNLIKGKAPSPPSPKAPKPESWMYEKPSYKLARDARKKS